MSKSDLMDMLFHFIFLGLFAILFILLWRIDNKQDAWYAEEISSAQYNGEVVDEIQKTVDRIDRRLLLS